MPTPTSNHNNPHELYTSTLCDYVAAEHRHQNLTQCERDVYEGALAFYLSLIEDKDRRRFFN